MAIPLLKLHEGPGPGLLALRHGDGSPMVRIHGPEQAGAARGGTVALNPLGADGRIVDERIVTRDSAAHGISLRTGCFRSPGAGEATLAGLAARAGC